MGMNSLPRICAILSSRDKLQEVSAPADMRKLSPRQMDVVKLICEGLRNDDIAKRLHLGRYTIKQYVQRIYVRLGIDNSRGSGRDFNPRALLAQKWAEHQREYSDAQNPPILP